MTHWLTDGKLNSPMGKPVRSVMKKMQKHTSMTSSFQCIFKGNDMNHVGILTIYTRINLPDVQRVNKRLTAYKNYRCESIDDAKEMLEKLRTANPDMYFEAELVITRYID